jgi:hypothetical protein
VSLEATNIESIPGLRSPKREDKNIYSLQALCADVKIGINQRYIYLTVQWLGLSRKFKAGRTIDVQRSTILDTSNEYPVSSAIASPHR